MTPLECGGLPPLWTAAPRRRDNRSRTGAAVLLLLVAALPLQAQRTRAIRSADDSPAAWLARNAVAIATEPSNDDSDLLPLLALLDDARIIGLGDATHGTHEFFRVKQRLIPLLVRQGNVRTIVFEAPYAEFQRVSEYVRSGIGDPEALLESSDYYFWDAEEVLALIRWVREWNASGKPMVDVVGIDTFHPQTSAARVIDFLRLVDPGAAEWASKRYDCILTASPVTYRSLPQRSLCRDAIADVRPLLESRHADYASRSNATALDDAIHAARLVEQGEETLADPFGAARDEAMAENVRWLAGRRPGRIVIWGHNEHLGKTPYTLYDAGGTPSVGTILAEEYGRGYASVATIALQGVFHAIAYANGVGSIGLHAMEPVGADDYAALFQLAARRALIIPLGSGVPAWLAEPRVIRIAGSSVGKETTVPLRQDLAERFDAVIYVENSTPTRLRHFPVVQ